MEPDNISVAFPVGQSVAIAGASLLLGAAALLAGWWQLRRGTAEPAGPAPPRPVPVSRRARAVLWGVLALGTAGRVAVWGLDPVELDQSSYLLQAVWRDTHETFPGLQLGPPWRTILGITYSSFAGYAGHTPGFPWVVYLLSKVLSWLGAPYELTTLTTVGRVVSLSCGLAVLPLVWPVARRMVTTPWALAAVAYPALHPLLIKHTSQASPYPLAALLLTGVLLAQLVAWRRRSPWAVVAAGGLLGAAFWVHTSVLFLGPLALTAWALAAWRARRQPGSRWRLGAALLMLGGMMVVWAPVLPIVPWQNGLMIEQLQMQPAISTSNLSMGMGGVVLHTLRSVLGWPPAMLWAVPAVVAAWVWLLLTDRVSSLPGALLACGLLGIVVGASIIHIINMRQFDTTMVVSRYYLYLVPLLMLLCGAMRPHWAGISTAVLIFAGSLWGLAQYTPDLRVPDYDALAVHLEQHAQHGDALLTLPSSLYALPLNYARLSRQPQRGMDLEAFLGPAALPRVETQLDSLDPIDTLQQAADSGHRRIWAVDVRTLMSGLPENDPGNSLRAFHWLDQNAQETGQWSLRQLDVRLYTLPEVRPR
jgi:hypothetical protein